MKFKNAVVCLLSFAFCLSPADFETRVQTIGQAIDTPRVMETMRSVWERDRWFTFPKFEETIAYLDSRLRAAGLKNIEVLGAPADGVSQAGWWTMPLAWDVKQARLEVVSPERRVLADFAQIPASLCMWSGPANLEAELVEGGDAKGKFVLTRENPAGTKWKLARQGVAGVVNTFSENPSLKDGRQWINSWGDNGWAFTKGSAPLPCFSISPNQAEYVRGLLAKGPVRVRAVVDSRYYSGRYPYITAVLPGATTEEEILTLGHTAEQGAQDNATGVAAMVEALATLNRLIQSGALPRPRRTIRILAMPEMYGSMHYIQTHLEVLRRTKAALCVDTPAVAEYHLHLNPKVAASWTDELFQRVAKAWLGHVKRPWRTRPFMPGTDTFLADPMIGVPTVWPYGTLPVNTHHNSEDRPETVDADSLRDLTAITAAFLYEAAADSGLVVKRKRFGTLPLDDLPPDQREGYPNGAWHTTAILALYYCDGQRTLDEVIRLTEAELGPQKFDFTGYFKFLARRGYVELVRR